MTTDSLIQSLAVADKASFRNCLVSMCPNAQKVDLPSTHDISSYIHNAFVEFIGSLKIRIQVLPQFLFFTNNTLTLHQAKTAGRVSTTTDLWSVDQTKAAFMGLMAH